MRQTEEKMKRIQLENEKLRLEKEKTEMKEKLNKIEKTQNLKINNNSNVVFEEIEKYISERPKQPGTDVQNEFELADEEIIKIDENDQVTQKKRGLQNLDSVENENKLIFKRVNKELQMKQRKEMKSRESRRTRETRGKTYEEEVDRLKKLYSKFDLDNENRKKRKSEKKQQWNEQKMKDKFSSHFSQNKPNKFLILKSGIHKHDCTAHHCDLEKKYVNRKQKLKQKAISAWSRSRTPKKSEKEDNVSIQNVGNEHVIHINLPQTNTNQEKEKEEVPKKSERPKSNYNLNKRRSSTKKKLSVRPKRKKYGPEKVIVVKNPLDWRNDRSKSRKKIASLKEPKIGGIYGIAPENLPSHAKKFVIKKSPKRGFNPENLHTNLQSILDEFI
jgi:hypothetical protein